MALIEEAESPKDRAMLMILWELSEAVGQSTRVQKSLAEDLESHREELTAHLKANAETVNKGRGFWRGIMISVGVLQSVVVWQGKVLLDDYSAVKSRLEKLEQRYAAIEVRQAAVPPVKEARNGEGH